MAAAGYRAAATLVTQADDDLIVASALAEERARAQRRRFARPGREALVASSASPDNGGSASLMSRYSEVCGVVRHPGAVLRLLEDRVAVGRVAAAASTRRARLLLSVTTSWPSIDAVVERHRADDSACSACDAVDFARDRLAPRRRSADEPPIAAAAACGFAGRAAIVTSGSGIPGPHVAIAGPSSAAQRAAGHAEAADRADGCSRAAWAELRALRRAVERKGEIGAGRDLARQRSLGRRRLRARRRRVRLRA